MKRGAGCDRSGVVEKESGERPDGERGGRESLGKDGEQKGAVEGRQESRETHGRADGGVDGCCWVLCLVSDAARTLAQAKSV